MFVKVAEGYGGHTQNLALFEASNTMFLDNKAVQLNSQETTLHHIALNISLEDFESEKMRLEGMRLKVNAIEHEWLHVRSLYFPPPRGESAGVCLLRCKRGIEKTQACTHPDINVIDSPLLNKGEALGVRSLKTENGLIRRIIKLQSLACFAVSLCEDDHDFQTYFLRMFFHSIFLQAELTRLENDTEEFCIAHPELGG